MAKPKIVDTLPPAFIRHARTLPGVVTDGKVVQPIARVLPHNGNTRFLINNKFVKKADV